jgi:hypothetical protein
VPSMVVQNRPKLRAVPFASPVPTRTIALAHRTDVRPTRAAEEFCSTLLQLLSGTHTQGHLPAGVEFICSNEPVSVQSGNGSISAEQLPGPSSSRTTRHASHSE